MNRNRRPAARAPHPVLFRKVAPLPGRTCTAVRPHLGEVCGGFIRAGENECPVCAADRFLAGEAVK